MLLPATTLKSLGYKGAGVPLGGRELECHFTTRELTSDHDATPKPCEICFRILCCLLSPVENGRRKSAC